MPKISVVIITYNHEKWVDDAIQSVVDQSILNETEVIIHDDCSTDGTYSKVLQWRDRYPDRIRVLSPKENLGNRGIVPRLISLINEETHGTYLHILEGDDYWTDKDKLLKQASFLDKHPEFAMCYHNVNIVAEDGSFLKELLPQDGRGDIPMERLRAFAYAYLHLTALCFRNFKPQMPPEYFASVNSDMFLPFVYGQRGAAKFLNDISPSGYRQTKQGVWAGASDIRKAALKLQTGVLMASCLISEGDIPGAIGTLSGRVSTAANWLLGLLNRQQR